MEPLPPAGFLTTKQPATPALMAKDKELPPIEEVTVPIDLSGPPKSESIIIPAASLPGDISGNKSRGKYCQFVGVNLVRIPVTVLKRYKALRPDADGNASQVEVVDLAREGSTEAFVTGCPISDAAADGTFQFE